MIRVTLRLIVWLNTVGKRAAIRLTKWTGKSREYVHPKHLLGDAPWYMAHIKGRVLDLGCGHGAHALRAAPMALSVVGIDRDRDAIMVARRTCVERHIANAKFFYGDCEQPFPSSIGYETVLCLDLLEHIVNRDGFLAEIGNVLNPGGKLLLAVPNRATTWKRRLERAGLFSYSDRDHKIEYTVPELEAELARGGFRMIQLAPSIYDTPWVGLIDAIGGVSLTAYRWLTAYRRRLALRYPQESAGFYAVCVRA